MHGVIAYTEPGDGRNERLEVPCGAAMVNIVFG
jgi:hypothetical protein